MSFSRPFTDALAAFRRDHALLVPLAGLTMFLPQYALLLLVPSMPRLPDAAADPATITAFAGAVTDWAGRFGIWYLLAPALGLLGALSVMVLYLAPGRLALGKAVRRAGALYVRYLLASILVSLPVGGALVPAMASPVLLAVLLAPIFYIFGRTMLIAPAIVAEAPLSAVGAITRSWQLTRGHGWTLAAIYGVVAIGSQGIGGLLSRIGALAGQGNAANPVAEALLGGMASAVAAAAALTIALLEVAIYRRVARHGT